MLRRFRDFKGLIENWVKKSLYNIEMKLNFFETIQDTLTPRIIAACQRFLERTALAGLDTQNRFGKVAWMKKENFNNNKTNASSHFSFMPCFCLVVR
jgi:hypothetical protein